MATQFGFLSRLNFLQNWASAQIVGLNPAIFKNLEKYLTLKKVHYLSTIESVEGDYLEFGVFSGNFSCHSIRCFKKLAKLNLKTINTKFYGFDSFAGCGTLEEDDKHPFYKGENFATCSLTLNRKVSRVAGDIKF